MSSGPSSLPLITPEAQSIKDTEHLKLLVIFHYIFGGMTAFGSCFALLHVLFGLMMLAQGGESAVVGGIFAFIASLVVLIGVTIGGLICYSGRMIQVRQRSMFSRVMATICCCSMPVGTALGICTWMVLERPSVKALYDRTPQTLPPPPVLVDEHEESVWKDLEQRHKDTESSNKPNSEPESSA